MDRKRKRPTRRPRGRTTNRPRQPTAPLDLDDPKVKELVDLVVAEIGFDKYLERWLAEVEEMKASGEENHNVVRFADHVRRKSPDDSRSGKGDRKRQQEPPGPEDPSVA